MDFRIALSLFAARFPSPPGREPGKPPGETGLLQTLVLPQCEKRGRKVLADGAEKVFFMCPDCTDFDELRRKAPAGK